MARRGFTLIEALVALVLAGGGIAALFTAMGYTDKVEAQILLSERMQRLAREKLQEIIGTQDWNAQSGDFSDSGSPGFSWTLTVDTTTVENLQQLSLTVEKEDSQATAQTVGQLVYRPPDSTGATP